jgi:hypothetical protein
MIIPRPISLLATAAILLAAASPGMARGGGGDEGVRVSGNCTGGSDWKLKAKHDDGRIETEFEVDQNRSGAHWRYRIRRNGRTVARGTRVTRPPSGSFEVERRIANPAGSDRISAVAVRGNGETCRGSLRI